MVVTGTLATPTQLQLLQSTHPRLLTHGIRLAGKIVTGKSVPAGDYINFRLETNLNTIPTQRNSTVGFIDIKVKNSDGTIYTTLTQPPAFPLTDLTVNAMPYFWVPNTTGPYGWATGIVDSQGTRIYKIGVYTFWTECNLNGMKDNYKDASGYDYTGKTVSATQVVTLAPDTTTPTPTATPISNVTLSGQGDDVRSLNAAGTGLGIFSMTYNGQGNFIVWLKDAQGNNIDLLANEIDSYSGEKSAQLSTGTYYLDVTASGPWSIQITSTQVTTAPIIPTPISNVTLSGQGDDVRSLNAAVPVWAFFR